MPPRRSRRTHTKQRRGHFKHAASYERQLSTYANRTDVTFLRCRRRDNCALWTRCDSIGMDMEKSPEDLLRSIFGDEGPAELRPPRNGTPLFQLSRALPEF